MPNGTLTRWTAEGLRTARLDLYEHDVIFVTKDSDENPDTQMLFDHLDSFKVPYISVDRGDYLMISLVHTTGKAARRA